MYNVYNQWRISAHWDNKYATGFRAAHVCFIPAVKPDLYYIQLKTIRRAHFSPPLLLFRCKCSMIICGWDVAYPHRCVANIYSWYRLRATHACFIPAV